MRSGPGEEGGQADYMGGFTEEPEPAPEGNTSEAPVVYSPRREKFKSLAALIFVTGCWCAIFMGLKSQQDGFVMPDCPEEWPEGPPRSCEACAGSLIFLPLFGEFERSWPKEVRGPLYLVGLLWTFLGIGIVCDQFMEAIDKVTSATRAKWVELRSGARHRYHVPVWNPTVANLTLMALGSSAPEILLAVIEIQAGQYFAGELGPSTIVGSAAFNLLVITAVCVSAIPAPETRKIQQTDVFLTTAFFSIFAYIWMLIVLVVITPDKVDIWEGVVTFCMFPLLVVLSFSADKGVFRKICGRRHGRESNPELEAERLRIQEKFGKELPPETMALMLRDFDRPAVSTKAQMRKNVMRNITGGKAGGAAAADGLTIGFADADSNVLECAGVHPLKVVASHVPGFMIRLNYQTRDGSAKAGSRYTHVSGTLSFASNQIDRYIDVPIMDDDVWQPDEHFFCDLSDLQILNNAGHSVPHPPDIRFGVASAKITVLNDDMPGTLSFDVSQVYATEGVPVTIGIVRTHGHCGRITCKYTTVEGTATPDRDYEHTEGVLEFAEGETHKTIQVDIFKSPAHEIEGLESFQIKLHDPSPGVKFDPATDGGAECEISEIVIPSNRRTNCLTRACLVMCNYDRLMAHKDNWLGQFCAAFYCNGSAEDQSTAGVKDWFLHCVSLMFKVTFSIIPPPSIFGGWLCFVCALGMIGLVTAIVGDLATMLGCCIGIGDDITAITLVALGTSLPDTFASKLAAQQDEVADNSIGNVTGSNSVNVFLGLGLPWTLAALHWHMTGPTDEWKSKRWDGSTYEELFLPTYPDGGFIVPAGSLSLSVAAFTSCALCCLALLAIRRRAYGGELGGPKGAQMRDSIIMASLWFVYIGASVVVSTTQ